MSINKSAQRGVSMNQYETVLVGRGMGGVMDDRTAPRVHGHPARGRARVPVVQQSAFARWWSRIFKGVVGVGAVAAAVTAVIVAVQAVHPVDKEEFAAFKAVTVSSGVPYDEYHQRSVAPSPMAKSVDLGMRADVPVLVAGTQDAASAPVAPGAKEADATPPDPTPPGPTPPSTTPTTTDGPFTGQDPAINQDSMRLVLPRDVRPVPTPYIARIKAACAMSNLTRCDSVVNSFINVGPVDVHGQPLSSEDATTVLIGVVKGSRTTSADDGKRQMVGLVVDVNVELSGLRGKRVLLSWSLWRKHGPTQVFSSWLNDNLAYEMTARSEHDSAAVNFWIPLPKSTGPYVVRSKLTIGGRALATLDSEPIT